MRQFRNSNYYISKTGEVYSSSNKKISAWKSQSRYNTYMRVSLNIDGKFRNFRVHRLVAEVYLDNPMCKPEVHHIDSNTLNNHVDNLQWVTRIENENFKNKSKVFKK